MKRDIHNDLERQRRGEMKDGLSELRSMIPDSLSPNDLNTGPLLQLAISYIRQLEEEDRQLCAELSQLKGNTVAPIVPGESPSNTNNVVVATVNNNNDNDNNNDTTDVGKEEEDSP